MLERLTCSILRLQSSRKSKIKSTISLKVQTHSSTKLMLARVLSHSLIRTLKTRRVLQLRSKRKEAKLKLIRQRLKRI